MRIRSWRPAMPSISGPRSTVASSSAVTPFVSGAACSSLIVLSFWQGNRAAQYARAIGACDGAVEAEIQRRGRKADLAAGWMRLQELLLRERLELVGRRHWPHPTV